ncbi:MAG: PEGA domain-containing protein [Candidatus Sericytochromatia bacterium]
MGLPAGVEWGQKAFLPHLVMHPNAPLRLGWLPLINLDNPPENWPVDFDQRLFRTLSAELSDLSWQAINPPLTEEASPDQRPVLPYNQMIMELADTQGLDLVGSLRFQQAGAKTWLLFTVFSGADGSVMHNRRITVEQIEPESIARQMVQEIQNLALQPALNDLNPTGPEVHLRTTPEGMYTELNGEIVGLSPMILRGLPTGPNVLRIYELQTYQINRLRISSEPSGVKVRINGQELGLTPLDVPAELAQPGQFDIELLSDGSFEAELQVQTLPEGVPLQLGDGPIQRTPITFQQLDQRNYRLHLLPHRVADIQHPLTTSESPILSRQIDAYKMARLLIATSTEDAEVMIDRELVGETPFSSNLFQGLHTLRISKNRFRPIEETLDLKAGETRNLFFELRPRSADTSIFLTPTGEITPQLNVGSKYLTFGQLTRTGESELGHLYGLEVDYGWPALFKLGNFEVGVEMSAFAFALQTATLWRNFQGLGGKVQFLRESDTIPISAALGTYLNLDLRRPLAVGYLSLSRNFGDFALHLGLQTHGFNLNLGYTGWEDVRLGVLVYSDAFLRLLSEAGEESSTFYGLQLGYSF